MQKCDDLFIATIAGSLSCPIVVLNKRGSWSIAVKKGRQGRARAKTGPALFRILAELDQVGKPSQVESN